MEGFPSNKQEINSITASSAPKVPKSFADILPELAQDISKRLSQQKVDIIFIVDITGGMQNSIDAIKDNIRSFVDNLEKESIDVALGLVEFTDEGINKAKVFGFAKNIQEFIKWLDKTKLSKGGDLSESGYEALMTALKKVKPRKSSQRSFVFISDASQHDLDCDGKSKYNLDIIIAKLIEEKVRVDVIGPDYLPMKQLAWGTNGKWDRIPYGFPIITNNP